MTVGQRIAQKRKELGLSQEGLGDRLGVSRQAIYKWESDAALPEIEKLVNLSREFSVSIDWLLGREDEAKEPRELTPEQLRMVEEIVGRYLAARPAPEVPPEGEPSGEGTESEQPQSKKRRKWPEMLATAAAMISVAMMLFNLFTRLDRLYQDNRDLQMSIANIRSDVNSEIYGITRRVEEILQSQNTLTAEQSAQVADTDYRANTVTIEARAVPRTYVEGMTAEFTLVSGEETITAPGELGENHAFTAQLTAPLTDDITVSVAFLSGGQRQIQVLEQFTSLYSYSFPNIYLSGGKYRATRTGEATAWTAYYNPVDVNCVSQNGEPVALSSVRVGLFRDQKLVEWFIEEEKPPIHPDGSYTFWPKQETFVLEPGHTYFVAAVVEDEFGRTWVMPETGGDTVTEGGIEHAWDWELSRDPADWEY